MSEQVIRLSSPAPCAGCFFGRGTALFAYRNEHGESPCCQACMEVMSDMNSNNQRLYASALAELKSEVRNA